MSLLRARSAARTHGFVELVEHHGPALVRMARGLVRTDEDAADLVQDVLASALVHWPRVSAADEPTAYLNRMLVNAAMSWWRRPARREGPSRTGELPGDPLGAAAPDHPGALADRDELLAALRALPRRQRVVLVLRYYEGLADAEIAEVMGVGASTERSNAARGLATLRQRLPALEVGLGSLPG